MEKKLSLCDNIDFTLFFLDDIDNFKYLLYFQNKITLFFILKYNKIFKISEKVMSKDSFFIYPFLNLDDTIIRISNFPILNCVCIDEVFNIYNRTEILRFLTKLYILTKTRKINISFIINSKTLYLEKYYDLFKKFTLNEIKIK